MDITISPITTAEECQLIEQMHQQIWGSDPIEAPPTHMLITIAKEGGMALLARDETGQVIGFLYAFLALTEEGRLKLASHELGVLPAYQNRGIGRRMKLAQRKLALERQIDLITWTFDPLQSKNARFNLHKLGAVGNTYIRNLYGEMRDDLNRGLLTDRFRVDWRLDNRAVAERAAGRYPPERWGPILNPATRLEEGLLAPPAEFEPAYGEICLVEIPPDINRLIRLAPHLAQSWRLHTRRLFEDAFARGYHATDLLRRDGRTYYLLEGA